MVLRDSGIDMIGDLNWGTHIGKLYSSKDDFSNLAPFIHAGLKNNELCIWIYSQVSNYDEIKNIIGRNINDVDYYIEKGQLLLIPYTDWYIYNDEFDENRTLGKWQSFIDKSLQMGYDGLRAVADTSWLNKSIYKKFSDYESKVNGIIGELPFLVISLYYTKALGAFEITNIIKNHSYIITKYNNKQELISNDELILKNRQLEKSQEDYKNLLKLLPSAIFIHDEERIYYCNDSAMKLIRLSDMEFPFYKSKLETISSTSMNSSFTIFKEITEGYNNSHCIETELIYSNGDIKYIQVISEEYNYYGHPAIISVIVDKTPFRKIIKLEEDIAATVELEKTKTEFFSSMSHELRTPINVILGVIQLLEFQNMPEDFSLKDSKYLKIMKQNCLRLVRVVNNIIDLSKIDSDYYTVRRQNYDIVNLIKDITLSVVEFASNQCIEIIFDTNLKEKIIACDPDQIERIMLNLLSNAIKFTKKEGRISVTIKDKVDFIEIRVKDNGIGIPEEKLSEIFNRFVQVDKSLRRECEGSGIGLTLVKALVEKHNGRISVESEIGLGSEFIIELPKEVIQDENIIINKNNYICDYHNYIERIKVEFSDIYS